MGTRAKLLITLAGTCAVLGLSLGIASAATYVTSWGSHGSAPGQFQRPHDVAVDDESEADDIEEIGHPQIEKPTASV